MCNYYSICRLCAVKENTRNFTDINHHQSFLEILKTLLNIQVIKEENATPVCLKCFRLTNEFYSFFCLVRDGQKKLEELKNNEVENFSENCPLEPLIQLKVEEVDEISESKPHITKTQPFFEETDDKNSETDDIDDSKNDIDTNLKGLPSKYPKIFKNGKLILPTRKLNQVIKTFFDMSCEQCSESFPGTYELFDHYKSKHDEKGYVNCCGTRLYNRKNIVNHLGQHIQPSAFECPTCKKYVPRASDLREHLKNHLPDQQKPFKCEECNKSYSKERLLLNHKITHVPLDKREKLSCEYCGNIFTSPCSLQTHMSVMHRCSKTHLCTQCGKSFKALHALKNHMLSHDTQGTNQVNCDVCGIICKNYLILRKHMKHHSSNIQLKCELCDFTTHMKAYLTKHMYIKHSNIMHFECSVCKKQFKLKHCYESHMSIHTGEKKYRCPYCPMSFGDSGNFSKHKKKMHPEESKITASLKRHSLVD